MFRLSPYYFGTLGVMASIVCFLRGVNVGGNKMIKMDALRELCISLKLRDPRTYLQSGNVVFTAAEGSLDRMARRIEDAIEKRVGFRPDVILRTADEMRDVVKRNPFAGRADVPPNKLIVVFLAAEPGKPSGFAGPEDVRISGREAYIYYVNGQGRSRLTLPVIEKALGARGTARNWNTVNMLLEMAAESTSPS
jgi:uncharacterized protein (DUF1697 family)